jgi:DNA-binding CsgD family transcriptional regulator
MTTVYILLHKEKNKIPILMLAVFFMAHVLSFGQSGTNVDSLNTQMNTAYHDTSKALINIELSYYYITSDLAKALYYAEKALELAENSGNAVVLSKSMNMLGIVYFDQGYFELALAYYQRSLKILKSLKNVKGVASVVVNIGAINLNIGNDQQAKKNFTEALSIFQELEPTSNQNQYSVEIASTYNNLGIACQKLKEYKQAEQFYQKGIELARKEKMNTNLLANLLNNLGSVWLDQKQPDKAYGPILQGLEIRLQLEDKKGEAQSYNMLALYHIEKANTAKALEYLQKGYFLALAIGNISLQSALVEKLFEEYNKLQKPDSALKYHVILSALQDEINNAATQREVARIEITAQFREREQLRELEQIRKENRYYLILAGLFMSVVVFILLFLLSQNRLKRLKLQKDIVDMAAKNLELQKSALEKTLELRNKELTTNVMYLLQKNEYITDIAERLTSIKKDLPENNFPHVDKLIYDLKSNRDDQTWKEFEIRFMEVHQDFYTRLNEQFPDLTPNERKLAAFLRLNMTTKDISAITFQLPDTIKTARSRLRKKLGLTQEANLIAFLENI